METPKWLKPIDVARILGIPTREVYRLIDTGSLPAYRFGRAVRLRAADVEDFRRGNLNEGDG